MILENKKLKNIVALCLLAPLVLIAFFTVRMLTGSSEFDDINSILVKAPDGSEFTLTENKDLMFYSDLLENATFLSEPLRDLDRETPALVTLNETEYVFYLTQSPSGCMVGSPDGRLRLLGTESAVSLLVRPEMQYLYAADILPRLTVRSGQIEYDILPDSYEWQYKKADERYYADTTTEKNTSTLTCNLYSDYSRELVFTTEPSHYSLNVSRILGDGSTVVVPVSSLSELDFSQDTMLSVEISAKWSQASGNPSYGEASYRFRVLYDVPALVELANSEQSFLTVTAGDCLFLRAKYTNENEALSVSLDCRTGNAEFYYDESTQSSYALIAIDPTAKEGDYTLTVSSGGRQSVFFLDVRSGETDETKSFHVEQDVFDRYLSLPALEELENTLASYREKAGGRPLMTADPESGMFFFASPFAGEPVLPYYCAVMITADAMEDDSGVRMLPGPVYKVKKEDEVRSAQSGVVLFAGDLGVAGNAVIISHGMGVCSYYFHLDEIAVTVGDQVELGAPIGRAGVSGFTEGDPCLQFMLSAGNVYFRP